MLDKIKTIVNDYPNRVAYIVNNKSLTYAELWNKANIVADCLKRIDTSSVIIYGDKDVWVIISIIASIIARKNYVPIGSCTPINRLKEIVFATSSKLIITENSVNIGGIISTSLDNIEQVTSDRVFNVSNDYVYTIFTSGTTGKPKGVPISYDNLDNFINWISNLCPLNTYENIKVFNQASFSFDLSVADLYYSLCNGHTLIALDIDVSLEYDKIFDNFLNVTVAVLTPTFMKLCLINDKFNEINFPMLKCIYFCGERLDKSIVLKLYECFSNLSIINAYGPTEATSAVSAILITKDMLSSEDDLPVGDINNLATSVEIIDGEIVLKGNSVFDGYLNFESDNVFKEEGINTYKTGDLGYIKNNKLYCLGRKDRQIKYKGYRIELDDIEVNIKRINGVIDCAVVEKYNSNKTIISLKAFMELENGYTVDYVKSELANTIPSYMMPKVFVKVDKLPINSNGKIDRKVLSEL